MAYYDHGAAMYDKKCEEEYEKLKENLRKSKNEEDEMLLKHIQKLEIKAANAKGKVKKYEEFFETLQKLLPRQSSIHDVLG
jgi:hypothetical protein